MYTRQSSFSQVIALFSQARKMDAQYNVRMSNLTTVKLAAYLAHAGIAARRKSEELIKQGAVKVNGEVESNVARRVDPTKDLVEYKGKKLVPTKEKVLLALNKPRGVVSTVSDPLGKKVVVDFVPQQFRHLRLFPIGRLDEDTEGLILLTNDGAYAQRLTHPRYEVPKTYRAVVQGHLSDNELMRLRYGLKLKNFRAKPAEVEIEDMDNATQTLVLTIHEGKYHEVRRMMLALNHPVIRLKRLSMGPFELSNLRPGEVRQEAFLPLQSGELSSDRQSTREA